MLASLRSMPAKKITFIGVPLDLGAGRRGVDMGPSAFRVAEIHSRVRALGYEVADRGDIDVFIQETRDAGDPRMKYLTEIRHTCEAVRDEVDAILGEGAMPVVLGGDHSIAMGTLAGLARAGHRAGVIWMDAHGDINTPDTTPSGNVHGMPFAVALGIAEDPFPKALRGTTDGKSCVLMAIRDIDAGEKDNIKEAGVTPITMADIDRLGMAKAMEQAIAVAAKGDGIHLSLDMDAIDPDEAPGVGTPVRGGLTYREAQLAMEMLAASGKLRSIEVCEVNPILDRENRTATLAVELIASALGQTIL